MSAKDDSELCVLCKKEVKSTEIVFVCGLWCKKFFHNKCVGLSNIEARALMYRNKRVKFHCEACEKRLGIELFGGKETEEPRIFENCVNNSIKVEKLVQILLKLTSDLSNNNSEINKKLDRVLTSNSRLEEYILQSPRRFGERNKETPDNVVECDDSDSTNKISGVKSHNASGYSKHMMCCTSECSSRQQQSDNSLLHVDSDFTEQLTDSKKQNGAEGCGSNCPQEWEVSGGHNSVSDPLSIAEEECSPSEEFPLSFTNSSAKTENIEDEDITEINNYKEECSPSEEFPLSFTNCIAKTENIEDEDIAESNNYKEELKQDVEFTNNDNEPESITLAVETCNSIQTSTSQETSHLGHRCDIRKKMQDLKQNKHTGEVYYSCSVCKKTFIQHSRLKHHLVLHSGELKQHYCLHIDERPYTCDICNKAFKTSTHLKKHLQLHSGERPCSCDVCNKTFTQKSNLYRHFRIHTGERPYSCHVCNKRFKQSSHVKDHLRIHTGERYSCNVCNKSFSQKKSLNKHTLQHTGDDPIPV